MHEKVETPLRTYDNREGSRVKLLWVIARCCYSRKDDSDDEYNHPAPLSAERSRSRCGDCECVVSCQPCLKADIRE